MGVKGGRGEKPARLRGRILKGKPLQQAHGLK